MAISPIYFHVFLVYFRWAKTKILKFRISSFDAIHVRELQTRRKLKIPNVQRPVRLPQRVTLTYLHLWRLFRHKILTKLDTTYTICRGIVKEPHKRIKDTKLLPLLLKIRSQLDKEVKVSCHSSGVGSPRKHTAFKILGQRLFTWMAAIFVLVIGPFSKKAINFGVGYTIIIKKL